MFQGELSRVFKLIFTNIEDNGLDIATHKIGTDHNVENLKVRCSTWVQVSPRDKQRKIPPEQPTILDKWGRQLNNTVGPHEVGDDITLTCRTVGGHPQPLVRWMVNGVQVDDQYEHNAGDVIENILVWPKVSRKDLDSIFVCQAFNTDLNEPKETVVTLDLYLKPLTVEIRNTVTPLVADKRYDVICESAGSRPAAIITWYKGKRQLRRTKDEARENVTISELSFVPTTDDDGKFITCRAENPNVTGLFLETSWKIDVVCK
ncbi:hypothetical protein HHI36_001739 [Cryptolaemus montrouzieri]|uniref:Ig-like domain-containing protein n=1 Tax=Cryptolaemus montrouzieri TaxID=559131 RepID=A0ABD2P8I9_9CUCU